MSRSTYRLALLFLGVMYVAALGADFLAPYDYARQHRRHPLAPPTEVHFFDQEGKFHFRPFVVDKEGLHRPLQFFVRDEPDPFRESGRPGLRLFGVEEPGAIFLLGTDALGRDQLSRLLHGGRVSLFAGLLAGLLAVALGTALGAVAGLFGGWVDDWLMRVVELALALPWLYLLLAARAFLPLHLEPVESFFLVIAAIALVGWAVPARLARGVALATSQSELVTASRSVGVGPWGILMRVILPQAFPVALTQLALVVPQFILAEVTLSFLGLGVGEPVPSWGSMLTAVQGSHVLVSAWWMFAPAVVLAAVVLSYHQLAIVFQERLSPTTV